MSVLAIAEFFVAPEKNEAFLNLLKGALPDTRSFSGCESLETFVNQDDPGHVFLVEKWRERDNHEAYLGWRMGTAPPALVSTARFKQNRSDSSGSKAAMKHRSFPAAP